MAKIVPITKIIQQMDTLSELRSQTVEVDAKIQKLIDDAIPPAVLAKIQELKISRESMVGAVDKLEADIKSAVLQHGESIKGEKLQAVYAKGRETWDSKGLTGYAIVHPEILKLKKVGEPSVSLRVVKEAEA